jgi:hypothetical protein
VIVVCLFVGWKWKTRGSAVRPCGPCVDLFEETQRGEMRWKRADVEQEEERRPGTRCGLWSGKSEGSGYHNESKVVKGTS